MMGFQRIRRSPRSGKAPGSIRGTPPSGALEGALGVGMIRGSERVGSWRSMRPPRGISGLSGGTDTGELKRVGRWGILGMGRCGMELRSKPPRFPPGRIS